MTYEDFNNFPRGEASDKVLSDKACNIAKNPKYDPRSKILIRDCFNGAPLLVLILILLTQINLQVVLLKVKLCKTKNQ